MLRGKVKDKWNNVMKNFSKKDKKKLIALSSVAGVCILSLAILSFMPKSADVSKNENESKDKNQSSKSENSQSTSNSKNNEENNLEARLQNILSEISGSGEVKVMITYESSEEIQPAFNTNSTTEQTQEKDSNGGERTVTTSSENKTLITSGSNDPIVLKTSDAKIKGVIVVSSGANDPTVKQSLYSAVQTVLQVSGYQVEVYAK